MAALTPETPTLVPVKLTPAGRVQECAAPEGLAPPPGAGVIVQQEGVTQFATVVCQTSVLSRRRAGAHPGARVLRRASHDDVAQRSRQAQRERDAYRIALLKIRERGLAMKLTRVDQSFDGQRLVFSFTAEARVDFRELVRELASEFHTRIEMRQVGVRDEAKMLGGYGTCGRPLCCTTFLTTFDPVSIKMAKQQELSLNPSKLSGLCGRLKCCLRFELSSDRAPVHPGCGDELSGGSAGCGPCGCDDGSGCR